MVWGRCHLKIYIKPAKLLITVYTMFQSSQHMALQTKPTDKNKCINILSWVTNCRTFLLELLAPETNRTRLGLSFSSLRDNATNRQVFKASGSCKTENSRRQGDPTLKYFVYFVCDEKKRREYCAPKWNELYETTSERTMRARAIIAPRVAWLNRFTIPKKTKGTARDLELYKSGT